MLAACACTAQSGAVTPVEKVIHLLRNLQQKVEQEGKDEATAYDKYSCFCKEQADNKLYAIETSQKKLDKLDAKTEKLGTEITDLDGQIGSLSSDISGLETQIHDDRSARTAEHQGFLTNQAAVDAAIDTVERAVQALRESKKAMGGKAELELTTLAQVRKVALMGLAFASRSAMSGQTVTQLNALASVGQPGTAYTYSYKSNDIIATLENLRMQFKSQKAQIEQDEFDTNVEFELKEQSLSNEKKFAEKEKLEKEALRASKQEEKEKAEADRTQENKEKEADQNFMHVLKDECWARASLWDQRSTTRAAELTAIDAALTSLKTGVAPNWKANKKLVGLQKLAAAQQQAASTGHWVFVEDVARPVTEPSARPASFLQIHGLSLRGTAGARASGADKQAGIRVQQVLASAAQRLQSPLLSLAALKVSAVEDHFVKVRQIIKDLIERLNADANSEATLKSSCDTNIQTATETRDSEQSNIEDYSSQISSTEAAKKQLEIEIAELSKQISQNKKALAEATELRQEEEAENTKTISDSSAGKAAVEQALQTLREFYESSFVQRAAFVPSNSDREGLTVADRAPEVFDSEYTGSQEASKGIIGMLEVILSDFDRNGQTVTSQEEDAVTQFDQFKDTNEADTGVKEESVETKKGQITDIDADLVALRDNKAQSRASHELVLAELSKLHTMCIKGEETYEERVATRQKEIAALKEAHDILEHWQK